MWLWLVLEMILLQIWWIWVLVMGVGGQWWLWVVGLLVVLQNLHMREGERDKVSCVRNNKKLIKK